MFINEPVMRWLFLPSKEELFYKIMANHSSTFEWAFLISFSYKGRVASDK